MVGKRAFKAGHPLKCHTRNVRLRGIRLPGRLAARARQYEDEASKDLLAVAATRPCTRQCADEDEDEVVGTQVR